MKKIIAAGDISELIQSFFVMYTLSLFALTATSHFNQAKPSPTQHHFTWTCCKFKAEQEQSFLASSSSLLKEGKKEKKENKN